MPLTEEARELFAAPIGAFRGIGAATSIDQRVARIKACNDAKIIRAVYHDESLQHAVRLAARNRLAELTAAENGTAA